MRIVEIALKTGEGQYYFFKIKFHFFFLVKVKGYWSN